MNLTIPKLLRIASAKACELASSGVTGGVGAECSCA